jgi:ABC-type glycerol-3-phosphate transport system substrate-binding protein
VASRRERELTRGELLRAGAAFAVAGPHRYSRVALKHELRILQWAHPTPGYDTWLARRVARWGERNDARVTVEHVNSTELGARARAEIATRTGHDLVQFLSAPTAFQNETAALNEAVEEVSRRLGAPAPVARGTAYNLRTRRWFGFPDHFVPVAAVRRLDVWPDGPATWQEVGTRAPRLRRRGTPVAIGLANELDSSAANVSMLLAFGGALQPSGRLRARPALDYLNAIADLYNRGMPREVLDWNPASNNLLLAAGRASLIVNPLTALRSQPAGRLGLSPLPAGPAGRLSVPHSVGIYVLWRFSPNRELAQRFLVDQQLAYREHLVRSGFLNVPAWPAAAGGFERMRALAGERLAPIVEAARHTVGAGHPGPTNGAVQELLDGFLVQSAARAVAQGRRTAAEAADDAATQAEAVFAKWREAKLI